jgi:hypothetical protein
MRIEPVLLLVAALAVPLHVVSAPTSVSPLAPADAVDGMTQGAMTVKWWQWAASFQYAASPVSDATGERCGSGQDGAVWFLAGTYGSAPAHRTCHVPAGKHLFFPLINYVVSPSSCGGCTITCEHASMSAAEITNEPMGLFAELDGKSLGDLNTHRVTSPGCFNLAQRADPSLKVEPSASNGYWLLLPPLAKGKHSLRFGGSLPSLRQELIYTLLIE